jgi:putative phage-type endonuclease
LNVNLQGGAHGQHNGWKSARRRGWGHTKALLTASNFGTAIGHNPYKSKEILAHGMISHIEEEHTPEALANMARGTHYEPIVREWYEKVKGVRVEEVGLAIPKFDIRIGGSVDGLVGTDGCIEIKCPKVIYPKLLDPSLASSHPSHRVPLYYYDQMIGCMAITGRSWCDFVVCDVTTGKLYIERIPFDKSYWESVLYPGLVDFIERIIPTIERNTSLPPMQNISSLDELNKILG